MIIDIGYNPIYCTTMFHHDCLFIYDYYLSIVISIKIVIVLLFNYYQ